MKRKPYTTSKIPTIARLNVLVYKHWKPKWMSGSWGYGRIYYFGDNSFRPWNRSSISPAWFLDGMTPVGPEFVLGELERLGENVTEFRKFFAALDRAQKRRENRRSALRKSATAKLTKAEQKACGLL